MKVLAFGLVTLLLPLTAQGQPTQKWPALPKFDLKDYAIDPVTQFDEKKYVREQVSFYYKFNERTFTWPEPFRSTPVPPLLLEKAFKYEPSISNLKGTFALSPLLYDRNSQRHIVVSLKRVNGSQLSEVFYHAAIVPDDFHSPHLSPNGETMILYEGLPPDDFNNSFRLFVWNLNEGRLRWLNGPSDIQEARSNSLPVLKWSPGSRFLSYMRGGRTFADYDSRSTPYYLYCLDLPSHRDHLVMEDAGLFWSWTCQGSILCSHIKPTDMAANNKSQYPRPSVYEVRASGGEPRKVFDGGYYAQESPNGKWIAFCDWAGPLIDGDKVEPEVKANEQQGLFLFSTESHKRTFIGNLPVDAALPPRDGPEIQWSPDGQSVYVLLRGQGEGITTALVYKMGVGDKQMKVLARIDFKNIKQEGLGWFIPRGFSPDGKRLYLDYRQTIDGPEGYPNQEFSLIAVDTQTGGHRRIATLKDIANENPDWDFHDDSGVNPAFAAAEKLEKTLPTWNWK